MVTITLYFQLESTCYILHSITNKEQYEMYVYHYHCQCVLPTVHVLYNTVISEKQFKTNSEETKPLALSNVKASLS